MKMSRLLDYTGDDWHTGDVATLKKYAEDDLWELAIEETDFARCGTDEMSAYIKYKDSLYFIIVEFMWNRYDKQYYYLDGSDVTKWEKM